MVAVKRFFHEVSWNSHESAVRGVVHEALPAAVGDGRIAARLDQQVQDVRVAASRREVQRRLVVVVAQVRVCAVRQRDARHLGLDPQHGAVQNSLSVESCSDIIAP